MTVGRRGEHGRFFNLVNVVYFEDKVDINKGKLLHRKT